MRNRPRSGPGMYDYARPMYVWSIDGFKAMPYSSMKNDYEDVVLTLSRNYFICCRIVNGLLILRTY